MKSILLTIGGLTQILISLLHVGIIFGIASSAELTAGSKVTAHIFNAAVLTTVMFFAYVSLARKRELLTTNLGRLVTGFIAVFYLQRGLVEVFVRGFQPVNLALSLAIAALYLAAALPGAAVENTGRAREESV